jgi:CTP synthase (UTP-ammonia lyase)
MGVITLIFSSHPHVTKSMEETLQSLVTLKVREALILCGVNDAVNDPLKKHIMRISDLGEHTILLLDDEANLYST